MNKKQLIIYGEVAGNVISIGGELRSTTGACWKVGHFIEVAVKKQKTREFSRRIRRHSPSRTLRTRTFGGCSWQTKGYEPFRNVLFGSEWTQVNVNLFGLCERNLNRFWTTQAMSSTQSAH